jgi:cytochrome P450
VTDGAVRYDPASYAVQENPFPTYLRMQDEAPLYRNEEHGFWALTRYDDVLAGLNDPKSLSSARGTLIEVIQASEPPPEMMIFMDPPDHDTLRNLVRRAFTPRRVSSLEVRIRELCDEWLDPVREAGGGEIVADLAGRLPAAVIAALLGAPESDYGLLKTLSDRLLHREDGAVERPQDATSAGLELYLYFTDLVTKRRASPADDMTSALVTAEIEGPDGTQHRLNDHDIALFCLLLGVAGNETTAKLIATGTVVLAEFPDERARLIEQPAHWPTAVEELLRYDPPSHYQGRVTTRPMTWHGEQIGEGEIVLLVNGAANRDPREYDGPDRFIANRQVERHLAFGHGIHFCLGAALARLETTVALQELVRRFPDYEVDMDKVERFHSTNVRGLSKVPFARSSS